MYGDKNEMQIDSKRIQRFQTALNENNLLIRITEKVQNVIYTLYKCFMQISLGDTGNI